MKTTLLVLILTLSFHFGWHFKGAPMDAIPLIALLLHIVALLFAAVIDNEKEKK